MPFSGSKNSSLTVAQPPKSSIVKSAGGAREVELVGDGLLDDRPVALLGEDLLRLGGRRKSTKACAARRRVRRDRDRVLDQDRLVGDDVVDVLALLLGGDRLVLVGEQDVALAADEGLQRLAGALVLDGDVL